MSDDQRIYRQGSDGKEKAGADTLPQSDSFGSRRGTQTLGEESSLKRQYRKVALVHDWLNGMRGGEIVFESILDLYPNADVFTLVYEPTKLSAKFREKLSKTRVFTSLLNRFSLTRRYYRQLLPILPFAISRFDLSSYDLIISSSHCVAKGVKKNPKAFHLSYIHAPMRYMWDRFDDYFGKGRINPVFRFIAKILRPFLQAWDRHTSSPERVDVMLANSRFIAEKIREFYGRESHVVYPFAKLARFTHERKPGNFYLMVGAFAPYKRTDLAIQAFSRLGLPLKIVGQGQDEVMLKALREKLGARNIEFIRTVTNEQIEQYYSGCKAFLFPGKEDFGITPLESMASGAPVIAFGEGGACETVTPEAGILFRPQSVEALSDAVMEIESGRQVFSPQNCRDRASFFTEERFKQELEKFIP